MSGTSKIPEDILDDLSSRFIINIPKNERTEFIRVSFQIELAHWFYLDYYCAQNPELIPYKLREFFIYIFQHIPFLKRYECDLDSIYSKWREYKQLVPTFGAVLIDDTMSHILLVQSYMSSWGFPKGKVNQEEDPVDCACREVFEETGLNIKNLIRSNEFVESTIHDQLTRLYFVTGISKNVSCQPQTMGEIKAVKWFPIEQIPMSKKDILPKCKSNEQRYFYMVMPFMKRIVNWIDDSKRRNAAAKYNKKAERPRNKSSSDNDFHSNLNKAKKTPQNTNEKRKQNSASKQTPQQADPQPFTTSNYYNTEQDATEELLQPFENSSFEIRGNGNLSRRTIRNFRRSLNRKIRPDNYAELKQQLSDGSDRWKTFSFDRESIMQIVCK